MASVSERGVDHVEIMDGPEILESDRIDKLDKIGRRTFGLNDAQTEGSQMLVNPSNLKRVTWDAVKPEAAILARH